MDFIKKWLRRLILGYKADSESYVNHLRRFGMRIGEGTTVFRPQTVVLDETRPWLIEIGRNVQITQGVVILTHGYDWSVLKGLTGEVLGSAGKVTIGDNVFLGVNSVILKGVAIGDNVILGAGSVVTRDIPANCVAAGNPAKVLMTLEEYRKKRRAAQAAEAAQLVTEYRAVHGKDPGEAEMAEFFWLFSDDPTALPPCWQEKMDLLGNRPQSDRALRENKKAFQSMEDFLRRV